MLYWSLLSLAILVMPFLVLMMGLLRWLAPVKRINYYFGYRSWRSTRSKELWSYAQSFSGKVWTWVGAVLLVPGVVQCFVMAGKSMVYMAVAAICCIGVEIVAMLIAMAVIDLTLWIKFTWKGQRRTPKEGPEVPEAPEESNEMQE